MNGDHRSDPTFFILTRWFKDHRTGFQNSNPKEILDGDISNFIEEALKKRSILDETLSSSL